MTAVFQTALSLSLSGSLLVLILILFRPLYRKRLSKRWQYYIWLVVVARMLIPFAPETNLVGTLFQEFGQGTALEEPADPPGGLSEPLMEISESVRESEPDGLGSFVDPVRQNLWIVWLFVAAVLMVRKMTVYQSFGNYVRSGCREVEDFTVLERFGKLLEQVNLKYPVEIYTNSFISSPLLMGFFRPRIVLPTVDLPESDFRYTIQHELTHVRRGDMFYKWLVQITACLHWFNPFVYWMLREINRNCELSCDEAVIRELDDQGKRRYGDTLLRAMETGGSYKNSLASVTLKQSKALLKERLSAIMKFQKQSKWMSFITVILSLFLTVGAAAAGAYTETPAPAAKNEIFYEDGIYYLLLDGARKTDKPSGGVSEGSVGFTLVRKNGYTSIGPFDKLDNLVGEVAEQCAFMREEGRMTAEDAGLIVDLAEKLMSGQMELTDGSDARAEEYAAWGVQQKDGGYYFQDQRVRIFIDLRADNSFVTFHFDKKEGAIDLRLVRDESGSIKKAEVLRDGLDEYEKILG